MSVLNAIKGTIVSVKQDISQSLQHLTSNDGLKSNKSPVGSSAGAELLYRYTNCWKDIHGGSEDLARRAQAVDILISSLFNSLEKQNNAMNHFLSELSSVTLLSTAITVVKDRIGNLECSFSRLETELMELEDVCDEQDAQAKKHYHEAQLKQYRMRKHVELELVKVTLAAKHSKKVEELEAQISATLLERQKVFDLARVEQMQNYKQSGLVVGVPSSAGADNKAVSEPDLGDIAVDDGVGELERFLEDIVVEEATRVESNNDAITPVVIHHEVKERRSETMVSPEVESLEKVAFMENSAAGETTTDVKPAIAETICLTGESGLPNEGRVQCLENSTTGPSVSAEEGTTVVDEALAVKSTTLQTSDDVTAAVPEDHVDEAEQSFEPSLPVSDGESMILDCSVADNPENPTEC